MSAISSMEQHRGSARFKNQNYVLGTSCFHDFQATRSGIVEAHGSKATLLTWSASSSVLASIASARVLDSFGSAPDLPGPAPEILDQALAPAASSGPAPDASGPSPDLPAPALVTLDQARAPDSLRPVRDASRSDSLGTAPSDSLV